MIKKYVKYIKENKEENPGNFDHDKHIRETDDIEFLEQLLKYMDDDLKRLNDPSNFRVQAMMRKMSPEEYTNILKNVTLKRKITAENRLHELKSKK